MGNVIIFFDPENSQIWDLVLRCAEAGQKVSVCAVQDMQPPVGSILVTVPQPAEQEPPCQR